jgi:hypothetical protein
MTYSIDAEAVSDVEGPAIARLLVMLLLVPVVLPEYWPEYSIT